MVDRPTLELVSHMVKVHEAHGKLERLERDRKWFALADELANIQAAAREAEQEVNRILFKKE